MVKNGWLGGDQLGGGLRSRTTVWKYLFLPTSKSTQPFWDGRVEPSMESSRKDGIHPRSGFLSDWVPEYCEGSASLLFAKVGKVPQERHPMPRGHCHQSQAVTALVLVIEEMGDTSRQVILKCSCRNESFY